MNDMQFRWEFQWDLNYDGVISISDVWLWVKWILVWPGDRIIYWLSKGPALTFFELSPQSYGNWFSIMASVFIWLIVLLFFFAVLNELFGPEDRVAK